MIDAASDAIARIPVASQSYRIERADLIDRDPQAPAEQHGEAQANRESDDGDREAFAKASAPCEMRRRSHHGHPAPFASTAAALGSATRA
jgi:hypothetical protein